MPFLHLPVQSGSDAILQMMNRKHTIEDYLRYIERLRAARPDIVFSTDIIVGFPGESDADFAATIQLVRKVGFAQSFTFAYSRRPGTPAATLPNQVEEAVKSARLQELQALLKSQQENFNRSMIGSKLPVLFENQTRRGGQLYGRTPYMQAVHATIPDRLIGEVITVNIKDANMNSLKGDVVIDQAA
jgi:tRNA-2-methylthio-N6-dimethylallyladenosine synthase